MMSFVKGKKEKIVFSILIAFAIFGLHKWEAAFTSFFSFAVFFILCICFFNYFFVISFIQKDSTIKKNSNIILFIFSNLLVIAEAPAYFYSYILAIIILLFLIKRFAIVDTGRWRILVGACLSLFIFTLFFTAYLAKNSFYAHFASTLSIGNFLHFFLQNPFWIIKFYLIAQSGPFLGEAYNYPELRAFFGFIILVGYAIAIYHVIKTKDKRLLVPLMMIFYNVISYCFITMGRYVFNVIEYGSSSRYTAFNLSGVIGLVSILFFIMLDYKTGVKKYISLSFLIIIIAGYLYVDIRQVNISPGRVKSFRQMRTALLTGENLEILQVDKEYSLIAIDVLKKYNLNVYYGRNNDKIHTIKSGNTAPIYFISGTDEFNALEKIGFYDSENGISWTNGNSCLFLNQPIEIRDSLTIILNTYMPPNCKNVIPRLSFYDENKKEYQPVSSVRKEDKFCFHFEKSIAAISRICILSDTINAWPDKRTLSFPFKSLEITTPK